VRIRALFLRARFASAVLGLASLCAVTIGGCGGRSDAFSDGDHGGTGAGRSYDGGLSADSGGAAQGGSGALGSGGRRTQPGSGGRGAGGYFGAGGFYEGYGGYFGAGGFYPGYGGYFGSGGNTACVTPSCACADCVGQCTCAGFDSFDCDSFCSGVGGSASTGGFAGTGGFTSTGGSLNSGGAVSDDGGVVPGCNWPSCPSVTSGVGETFSGCCLASGTCGLSVNYPSCYPGDSSLMQCHITAHSYCASCACDNCDTSINPCTDDPLCHDILACAARTGCTGMDCLLQKNCQNVISAYGGVTGSAFRTAFPFLSCVRFCDGCAEPTLPPVP